MSAKRKQRSVTEDSEEARRQWAVPKRSGTVKAIDLASLDPADQDDRRLSITAEHPEYREALERGVDELIIDGHPVNPHLHIALHEVVASQLWHGARSEVWETAKRLVRRGYRRHDILHMLGFVATEEIWSALSKGNHTMPPAMNGPCGSFLSPMSDWTRKMTIDGLEGEGQSRESGQGLHAKAAVILDDEHAAPL